MSFLHKICEFLLPGIHSKKTLKQRNYRKIKHADSQLESRVMLISFVDANNDGVFNTGDVELNQGELDDGVFDTSITEGNYAVVIPGAGLVIDQPLNITNPNARYESAGIMRISNIITASKFLVFKSSSVIMLNNAAITAGDSVGFRSGGDLTNMGTSTITTKVDLLITVDGNSNLTGVNVTKTSKKAGTFRIISNAGIINMTSTNISGAFNFELLTFAADKNITLNNANIDLSTGKKSTVNINSTGIINANNAFIRAGLNYRMAADQIFAHEIKILLSNKKGVIEVFAQGDTNSGSVDIDLTESRLRAFLLIDIETSNTIDAFVDLGTGASVAILDKSKKGKIVVTTYFLGVDGAVIVSPIPPQLNNILFGGVANEIGVGTRPLNS